MKTEFCIVYCTAPDQTTAETIAPKLIEAGFAACINIVPGLTSFYQWEGELRKGTEVLMMIKTRQDKLDGLEQKILKLHPYDFPEFIAMPIIKGNQAYLDWVEGVLSSSA